MIDYQVKRITRHDHAVVVEIAFMESSLKTFQSFSGPDYKAYSGDAILGTKTMYLKPEMSDKEIFKALDLAKEQYASLGNDFTADIKDKAKK